MNRVLYFINYLFRSFHLHGIHSPFVFNLTNEVIRENAAYYAYDEIESIRAKLLLTAKLIKVQDYGAGPQAEYSKSIKDICKNSSQKKAFAQLIHRLARERNAQHILELGTSLGITTSYLAKACPEAKIISIEGSEEIKKVAEINLKKLGISNVKLQQGTFADQLQPALKDLGTVDLVYFDGHHDYKATLDYFKACLPYSNENSLFIFDDIHWSKGMKKAWDKIKQTESVSCSIDLFQLGLLYFDPSLNKEHHTVYHSANFNLS